MPILAGNTSNPNQRVYHSRAELIQLESDQAVRYAPAKTELVRTLSRLPGVNEVNAFPYELVIRKAVMWDWSEIEPLIHALIEPMQPDSLEDMRIPVGIPLQ